MFCCPFKIILLSKDVVNGLKYSCILYTFLLKKFNIPRNSYTFYLFEGVSSFKIASMRDFIGVIMFLSIICPRNLTRVRKKCDLSGAAFIFSCKKIYWYFLRQQAFRLLFVIAKKHRLNM